VVQPEREMETRYMSPRAQPGTGKGAEAPPLSQIKVEKRYKALIFN